MNTRKLGRIFGCMMLLLLPMLGLLYVQTEMPVIYIVIPDNDDASVKLASDTIQETLAPAGVKIVEVRLSQFDSIPRNLDALVIIGHGQPNGLQTTSGLISWDKLYSDIYTLNVKRTVVLACHSPTVLDEDIFGFVGQIDAEAGAILSAWHIGQVIEYEMLNFRMQQSIISLQTNMRNPLGHYVCFVHGYFGDDSEFDNMINSLWDDLSIQYDGDDHFDYFADYPCLPHELVHYELGGISTYAQNFYLKILSNYSSGDTISIVAHSMGGLIVREMLRLKRTDIENAGITIDKIITLGTPHFGTIAAEYPFDEITTFVMALKFGQFWESPVFLSFAPTSGLILTQLLEIDNYYQGIEWYTIAGIDYAFNAQFMGVFGGDNDGIISVASAHLPFSTQITIDGISHGELVDDSSLHRSYGYVDEWLVGPLDSDDDGLTNCEELSIYHTNPYASDTDSDDLSDYDEVNEYGTNPLDSDSDMDGIPDGYEITIGTDPLDSDTDDDYYSDNEELVIGTDPLDSDTDDDLFPDGWEEIENTDPLNPDTDGDGILDGHESGIGCYPDDWDSDDDGMPDGWEYWNYLDPASPNADDDYDEDGLTNLEEYLFDTDPYEEDTDFDGLTDFEEQVLGTNPNSPDSDSDNMPDAWEVQYGLNPLSSSDANDDTDSDDLENVLEYAYDTNPNDDDSDDDQIPDGWEVQNGLAPTYDDAQLDPDQDGLSNLMEFTYSTNPQDSDSDNDGLSDWNEIYIYSTDPLDSDTDDDSLTDGSEVFTHGTNVLAWSTDADILSDGQEIAWGYNPNDSDDPIEASDLISSAWSKSTLGYVRVNDPPAVDFVKIYVKYKDSSGWWTNYEYKGQINDVHPVYEDYYMYWTLPYGYVQMKVYVKAYDSGSHFIGSDVYYASISSGGGGDPPPI